MCALVMVSVRLGIYHLFSGKLNQGTCKSELKFFALAELDA